MQILQQMDIRVITKITALPLAIRMETRLPCRPTRGSLTSPSYLARNRTLGPPLENNPEPRITDLLAERAQVVARYSGGDNAGHTVTVGRQIFKLHLLPSGLVHPSTVGVLGNGMVINPARLLDELDRLAQLGVDVSPERVKISGAAHLITPAHIAL